MKIELLAELGEQVYREVHELYEGDRGTADLWLSSPIRASGNQALVALIGTEAGLSHRTRFETFEQSKSWAFKQKRTFESGLFSRGSKLITVISSSMIGGANFRC